MNEFINRQRPDHLNPAKLWAKRRAPSQLDVPYYGVYFLLAANGTVMYVGQGSFVPGRISCHKRRIPFAYFAVLEADSHPHKCQMEREAIHLFHPPYNSQHNTGPYPFSLIPSAPKFRNQFLS